jgi:2-keto-4-pentenoate hydratase/2-oxohepta-3-ene-1,7-dioic acid hydratase in catechol pathway
MRVGTAIAGDGLVPVIERDGAFVPLAAPDGWPLRALIAAGAPLVPVEGADELPASGLTAPLVPSKIVAIGLNYRDHIRETGLNDPPAPLVFTKFTSSITGPWDEIVIDRTVTERVDWEAELGVVVGRTMRGVPAAEALDYVFGYTAGNDVSARDLQFADGQWVRGKSLDTFCPLGPTIVSADSMSDPQDLWLRTYVNGETVQDSSTAEMIFGVAELLAFCSHNFTLEPGDLLLTGTPWGCGEWATPPRSLHHGDLVEVAVEGIGTLRNRVVEQPGPVTHSGRRAGAPATEGRTSDE